MQNDVCLKLLAESNAKYRHEFEKLEKEKRCVRQQILDRWAKDNAKYKVGDVITANDTIIEVTRISGTYSDYLSEKLYVTYIGNALTKKLTPRKDGHVTQIYDDGRIVEKLK